MGVRVALVLGSGVLACAMGCQADPVLRSAVPYDWRAHVFSRDRGEPGDIEDIRFRPGLCQNIDLKPQYGPLEEEDLIGFLNSQRLPVRKEVARSDLIYFHVAGAGTTRPVQLRVATLESADKAGRELKRALLQHGPGSWGVRRANIAVLGPLGSVEDVVGFAARTHLACWGIFTVAGRDDTFVIPGAYTEL